MDTPLTGIVKLRGYSLRHRKHVEGSQTRTTRSSRDYGKKVVEFAQLDNTVVLMCVFLLLYLLFPCSDQAK